MIKQVQTNSLQSSTTYIWTRTEQWQNQTTMTVPVISSVAANNNQTSRDQNPVIAQTKWNTIAKRIFVQYPKIYLIVCNCSCSNIVEFLTSLYEQSYQDVSLCHLPLVVEFSFASSRAVGVHSLTILSSDTLAKSSGYLGFHVTQLTHLEWPCSIATGSLLRI